MGRLKKSVRASRSNGALAKNKGLAVDVKKELFGGYSPGGTYHINTVDVRRTMAKGEVRGASVGCEHDVFTYCLHTACTMAPFYASARANSPASVWKEEFTTEVNKSDPRHHMTQHGFF